MPESASKPPPSRPTIAAIPAKGITRRWRMRAPGADADAAPTEGQGQTSLAQRVLAARGITGPGAADFLDPKLTHLLSPELIPDIDRAARRLLSALESGERIVIYGDYDVDGITATAILFHVFRALSPRANVGTYVPHRVEEGYGLNPGAIEQLAAEGARVIVSVDCGVTAVEPARRARELGVDLIITDHHNPPARLEDLPPAFAVVHPRRPDSLYPHGDLCGSGVAYKLAWRMATLDRPEERAAPHVRAALLDALPLAALGAIADVVPLVGENRVLTRWGLLRARGTANIGLRALIKAAGLEGEKVDAMDVGFKLAPRLNASGRMAHAALAVEMFTVADPRRAAEIAEELEGHNRRRRAVELAIFEEAAAMAEAAGMTRPECRAIVLAHPGWHPGVVGIVCSRLVEKFGRPALLMNLADGSAHGSGRSIDGFNLHGALVECAAHLTRFGGHDMAAGMALEEANVAAFTAAFTAHANAQISVAQLTREALIDARAEVHELTVRSVLDLEALAPFGRGNAAPLILLRDLVLTAPPMPMGKTGDHVALTVRARAAPSAADGGNGGGVKMLRLIAWRWGEHRAKLASGNRIEALVRPAISTFSGSQQVEPEVVDIALV
ncbi:single-stranded-DNA-specific exonuclease RecJ [soil metagenome]